MRPVTDLYVYTQHAWRETFRTLRTLITIVMIVCGITVPLVVLQGITDGLIRQQEQDFLKSPSAIQIDLAATGTSGPITAAVELELCRHPSIAAVIPDTTKVVDLRSEVADTDVPGVTLRATQLGDPLLEFYGADVLHANAPGIVISQYLADRLQLDLEGSSLVPPQVTLTVTRQEGHGTTDAELILPVRAVADLGSAAPIAYVHRHVLDRIEDFQQGRSVEDYGWTGFAHAAPVTYESYLAFSKQPLAAIDELKLRAHGLTATLLKPSEPDQEQDRTLWGLLRSHELSVYRLSAEGADPQADAPPLLNLDSAEIEHITDVDDIIIPWSAPQLVLINSDRIQAVGLTVRRRWLKAFFHDAHMSFSASDGEFSLRWPDRHTDATSVDLQLASGTTVSLQVDDSLVAAIPPVAANPVSPLSAQFKHAVVSQLGRFFPSLVATDPVTVITNKPSSSHPATDVRLAVIPSALLAHLKAAERNDVTFDEQVGHFVSLRPEAAHYQARIIANDIHAVPEADALLSTQGFATQSQRTRVEELQGYSHTLQLLVYVVGGTVLLFGLWTLVAALAENTDRKRRSLGALRMMGVGRLGVAYIVIVRGVLIGVVAGAVTVPLSLGLGHLLTEHLAACVIAPQHLLTVFVVAVGACLLGVLIPAVMASLTSPAEVMRDSHLT
ncbi:MAG: ABC transporter permease [Planctomycetaceae bacterium]|nr:ABC transporter permease [Planctomycetaceae bacterium]